MVVVYNNRAKSKKRKSKTNDRAMIAKTNANEWINSMRVERVNVLRVNVIGKVIKIRGLDWIANCMCERVWVREMKHNNNILICIRYNI